MAPPRAAAKVATLAGAPLGAGVRPAGLLAAVELDERARRERPGLADRIVAELRGVLERVAAETGAPA